MYSFSTTPFDEFMPCGICHKSPESDCECPECPVCGEAGNPGCAEGHKDEIVIVYGYQNKTPYTGACSVCGCSIGMEITAQYTLRKSDGKVIALKCPVCWAAERYGKRGEDGIRIKPY